MTAQALDGQFMSLSPDNSDAGHRSRSRPALAVPVLLLLLALAMPPETSVSLGGLRLSPYRLLLLLTIVPCLSDLLSGRAGRLHIADLSIFLHAVLCAMALGDYGGFGQAIESGGIYFVESVGAYALARRYVRGAGEFAMLARAFAVMVFWLFLFSLPESLSGNHFLRESFRAALGGPSLPMIEARLGLARAFGTFEHPILFGVFCSSAFALTYYVARPYFPGLRGWALVGGVIGASFTSLSAGAWLMVGLQLGLIVWDRATRTMPGRWLFLSAMFGAAIGLVSLLSNRSPVKVFISYASFSAQSAYNRILIWDYGTAEVGRHPFLGIGLGDWVRAPWMSDSMDNFWLVVAVRYGLPALGFLMLCVGAIALGAAKQTNRSAQWNRARSAWLITIAGVSIAACTVHLWNNTFCLFMFFIGAGAWLLERAPENEHLSSSAPSPEIDGEVEYSETAHDATT